MQARKSRNVGLDHCLETVLRCDALTQSNSNYNICPITNRRATQIHIHTFESFDEHSLITMQNSHSELTGSAKCISIKGTDQEILPFIRCSYYTYGPSYMPCKDAAY